MIIEPIKRNLYPLPSIITFSPVNRLRNPEVREKMTQALILAMEGHDELATQFIHQAIGLNK